MKEPLKEAAAKNKRGRPKSATRLSCEAVFNDKEIRNAMNMSYAAQAVLNLLDEPDRAGGFFVTEKGNFRRQGIAEQLGRMLEAEIPEDFVRDFMNEAIEAYQSGKSCKEIEHYLRQMRLAWIKLQEFDFDEGEGGA